MPVHQHNAVLLTRLLALKDYSPFILIQDSIAQSADYLLLEFLHRIPETTTVLYLSFESHLSPKRANKTISCRRKSPEQIQSEVRENVKGQTLVVIDTLTYVPTSQLTAFLMPMIQPSTSIVATLHTEQILKSENPYYPSAMTLLSYFATATILVSPVSTDIHTQEAREADIDKLNVPVGCNKPKFEAHLSHRRRSGRTITAEFVVDYKAHSIEYLPPKQEEDAAVDEKEAAILKGLTTFNLEMTEKQREEKEKVDLPFYHAQEFGDGGAKGGAIIYEFEKDDDYDEEDPYEDPF